jgi:hypothetical protein
MRRVLVTGMSGTGKSSALAEVQARDFRVVDTDEPGWKERRGDELVWREHRISELLARRRPDALRLGLRLEPGRFYDRFDAVVLSARRPA